MSVSLGILARAAYGCVVNRLYIKKRAKIGHPLASGCTLYIVTNRCKSKQC